MIVGYFGGERGKETFMLLAVYSMSFIVELKLQLVSSSQMFSSWLLAANYPPVVNGWRLKAVDY